MKEKIKAFLEEQLNFKEVQETEGVFETDVFGYIDEEPVTFGITYENSLDKDNPERYGYYYNIFIGEEYLDLNETSVSFPEEPISEELLESITKELERTPIVVCDYEKEGRQ